jgi:hypothetical protein
MRPSSTPRQPKFRCTQLQPATKLQVRPGRYRDDHCPTCTAAGIRAQRLDFAAPASEDEDEGPLFPDAPSYSVRVMFQDGSLAYLAPVAGARRVAAPHHAPRYTLADALTRADQASAHGYDRATVCHANTGLPVTATELARLTNPKD